MKKLWKNEKAVILGLSLTGEATARYLNEKGADCTVSESRQPVDADKEKINELESLGISVEMGGNKDTTIMEADIIVTSPGISPRTDLIKKIKENHIFLISEPELAYIETTIPIIAITGTNGKTTTTNLISQIFIAAGYKAPVCGNIGYPIINEVDKDNDFLIAELSSFQLEYSKTFKPQIGVFLNYTADHVDWHGSEEEYLRVKTEFLKEQRSPMWCVLNACDKESVEISKHSTSTIYWFGKEMEQNCAFIQAGKFVVKEKGIITPVLGVEEIQIKGNHNYQNIMASIATARLSGIEFDVISQAVKDFKSVEHRLEYVTTIDGIEFYNDSKATNCDAAISALKAFEGEKIVLIAGGRDKGTDLTEFVDIASVNTSAVILIGEATERFAEAFQKVNYSNLYKVNTLKEAVDKAYELKSGPVVLSPACASYDMFKNFEERGHVFKDIVNKKK